MGLARTRTATLGLAVLLGGCAPEDEQAEVEPRTHCAEPTELRASPETIQQAVDFINELPHPVSLDCFIERLERPVPLAATSSLVSLQPAVGSANPRLFLFYGDLIMSVAIDGDPGRTLLEFGEIESGTQTVKGEIAFPVSESLVIDDAFERIENEQGGGTKCRLCHRGERPSELYERGFVSDGLAFIFNEHVDYGEVYAEYLDCRHGLDYSPRCERYRALFEYGEVYESDFPEDFPTFLDYD